MRLALIVTGLILFSVSAEGQSDSSATDKRRAGYFNYFGSGALIGKKGYGVTTSFSTIHGVRLNGVAIGLGAGYDDYNRVDLSDPWGYTYFMRWKAVPLFLSLSADFGKIRDNVLFFQFNGGYTLMRAMKRENMRVVEDSEGGVMINPSLDYRITSGKHRIYIGAGYKMQRNRYEYNSYPWMWGAPESTISVKETMQRMEVHIGFGWN